MESYVDLISADRPRPALYIAGFLTAVICLLSRLLPEAALDLAYMLPIGILGVAGRRRAVVFFALICGVLREQSELTRWDHDAPARILIALLAYLGIGLFISEAVRSRRSAQMQSREMASEIDRRKLAEQQLRSIVDGSPAAIISTDPAGQILLANEAAHELLKCEPQSLIGQSIDDYIPTFAGFRRTSSLRKLVRTMLECTCRRRGGENFLAHIWISSSGAPGSTGLSAVVFDASEQFRNREEGAYHTLALSARIIAGSFFHEVRNYSSAMRVLTNRLKQMPGAMDTEEVEGLSALASGLDKLVSSELHPRAPVSYDTAGVRAVLDQLRIVIEPWFEDAKLVWREAADLPLVRADQHALLQVFLNLARNAKRALETAPKKELGIDARVQDGRVVVNFRNLGKPPQDPETLFLPFAGPDRDTGVGLYVSKAIVRSFGGDLRYEPMPDGSCFTVILEPRNISKILEEAIHEEAPYSAT